MPNISKLSSHKSANSTIKVKLAFDGVIMSDYLPDYIGSNEGGRHTNLGTHSAAAPALCRSTY